MTVINRLPVKGDVVTLNSGMTPLANSVLVQVENISPGIIAGKPYTPLQKKEYIIHGT